MLRFDRNLSFDFDLSLDDARVGAPHPRRWSWGRWRFFLGRRRFVLGLISVACSGPTRRIGACRVAELIGLSDQAGELGQGIVVVLSRATLIAAVIEIASGKTSVLISISHRDDASLWEKRPPLNLQSETGHPGSPQVHLWAAFRLPHFVRSVDAQNG